LLDSPLAVCDARTVKANELVASDLVYLIAWENLFREIQSRSSLFYVPRMTADEILLLKCFDSKTDGRARFAPIAPLLIHYASRCPAAREHELRTLVFHAN